MSEGDLSYEPEAWLCGVRARSAMVEPYTPKLTFSKGQDGGGCGGVRPPNMVDDQDFVRSAGDRGSWELFCQAARCHRRRQYS